MPEISISDLGDAARASAGTLRHRGHPVPARGPVHLHLGPRPPGPPRLPQDHLLSRGGQPLIALAVEPVETEIGAAIGVVAGAEIATDGCAAWIADRLDKPMIYVRKKPKGFDRVVHARARRAAMTRGLAFRCLARGE